MHHYSCQSAAKGLLTPIADIKKADKNTVVFELNSGSADWAFIMSDYHLPIYPNKDGKMDWQSGIGTGAYVLQNFDPGVNLMQLKIQTTGKKDVLTLMMLN